MKELGNLAVVCAKRKDNVLLQVHNGKVSVHVGDGPDRRTMNANWADNEKVKKMIHELNFGKYAEEKAG